MKDSQSTGDSRAVAIYHCVYAHETFEDAAQTIMKLLIDAQTHQPDVERRLFLDIDGHRNNAGGFDHDMLELQSVFLVSMVFHHVKEIHCPLFHVGNEIPQRNDVPGELFIVNTKQEAEKMAEELKIPLVWTDGNDFVPKEEDK